MRLAPEAGITQESSVPMPYFLHMTFLFCLHAVMSTPLVTLHNLCTLHSDVTLKQMRHAAQ